MTPHTATASGARRRGGLGRAVAVAAFAGALACAGTALAQTKTLKMQSTWPASLTLQDNFKMFAERVEKLTAGTLKIEVHAAGQIVPPFEILDATSKKVIASLKDELGREVQGEKAVEVVYQAGKLSKTVDQFGVGKVLPPVTSAR